MQQHIQIGDWYQQVQRVDSLNGLARQALNYFSLLHYLAPETNQILDGLAVPHYQMTPLNLDFFVI
jgi:hypothetical protein